MRVLSRRAVAATAALTMLAGLTGCGDDGGSATPGPEATNVASTPDLGFAITPAAYPDPFSGALDAAAQAPALAVLLAKGLAAADKRAGDLSSPAADLGAALTSLLVTHVYAFGTAVTTAYATSPTSSKTEAANAALDTNSKRVVRLVESLAAEASGDGPGGGRGNSRPFADPDPDPTASPSAGKSETGAESGKKPSASPTPTEPPFDLDEYNFAKAWRTHIDVLVDYAFAAKESNDRDKRAARSDLDDWRAQAGQYFRAISKGRLSSAAVRGDLGRYVGGLTEAIDAMAKKDSDGYVALREAADALPEVAARLTAGLAAATDRSGSVSTAAAELRNQLTATLIGHTYLAALSYLVAFRNGETGLVSPGYRRVQVSLDDNSKQIAGLVRELRGPVKEAEFLQGWRIHLRDLENYARGLEVGDIPARSAALTSLDTYLGAVSTFFRSLTRGELAPAAVEQRLRDQVAALIGVVDALQITFAPNGA